MSNSLSDNKGTHCVHSGGLPDEATAGVNSPVYTSSAFDYRTEAGVMYPRYFNTPNQMAVARKIAALEETDQALIFSSGLAATYAAFLTFLKAGDHILLTSDIYGGTQHLVQAEFPKLGITFDFVDCKQESAIAAAIRPNTKMLYVETPSNPLMRLTDLELIGRIVKKHELISMCDNTFASPINQNPIKHGIDVVMHSGTKYLGGHSDLIFGVLAYAQQHHESIRATAVNLGGNINAQTASLIERSMKTLHLRVREQNANALRIAQFLQAHPKVDRVHYPGLATHPEYELAKKQMSGFGGMLSFEIKDADLKACELFLNNLKLIRPAVSLGGVETLINSSVRTSHAKLSLEERAKAGIKENLLRLSVGIETVEDLIQDLQQSLQKLGN